MAEDENLCHNSCHFRVAKFFRSPAILVKPLILVTSMSLQAMTPQMQLAVPASTRASAAEVNGDLNNKFAGDAREPFSKGKLDSHPRKLGDTRQGNISVEIWKKAFTDALKRLCPLQGEGHDCGCLPVLKKMVGLHNVSFFHGGICLVTFMARGFTRFLCFCR